MVGPNLPFGGLACGLVLGPLPSERVVVTQMVELYHVLFVDILNNYAHTPLHLRAYLASRTVLQVSLRFL